ENTAQTLVTVPSQPPLRQPAWVASSPKPTTTPLRDIRSRLQAPHHIPAVHVCRPSPATNNGLLPQSPPRKSTGARPASVFHPTCVSSPRLRSAPMESTARTR